MPPGRRQAAEGHPPDPSLERLASQTHLRLAANQRTKEKVGAEINAAIAIFKEPIRSRQVIPFAAPGNGEGWPRGREERDKESSIIAAMAEAAVQFPKERRRREGGKQASRTAILEAARRVAVRDGAHDLFPARRSGGSRLAPAALYGYFRNKDELLLALAAEDLTQLARVMKGSGGLAAAGAAALDLLTGAETMAAASAALAEGIPGLNDAERLFNGRLIAALKALSDASGMKTENRDSQCDVVLVAASVAGLALLARSSRLEALGFSAAEMIARLDARFRNS